VTPRILARATRLPARGEGDLTGLGQRSNHKSHSRDPANMCPNSQRYLQPTGQPTVKGGLDRSDAGLLPKAKGRHRDIVTANMLFNNNTPHPRHHFPLPIQCHHGGGWSLKPWMKVSLTLGPVRLGWVLATPRHAAQANYCHGEER
jgi:hypothetical protein